MTPRKTKFFSICFEDSSKNTQRLNQRRESIYKCEGFCYKKSYINDVKLIFVSLRSTNWNWRFYILERRHNYVELERAVE